jgi:HD-like signal output (HDOD) protein
MQAAKIDEVDFFAELRDEVTAKKMRLPTLPDVAMRVKTAAEGDCSAQEIAALVTQDIALSGRLVQVANSPLYRGAAEVNSIKTAVTRLGTKTVRSLVIGIAVKQMFSTSSNVLSECFRKIWEDGVQIAAISRILADASPELDPEQAMLGGLLHNVGALPILGRLDEMNTDNLGADVIQQLIDEIAPRIGTQILASWNLPEALIEIPEGCRAFNRDSGPNIDYVDIVLASRLQHLFSEGLVEVTPELSNLPALEKLGINFEVVVLEDENSSAWAKQIRQSIDL